MILKLEKEIKETSRNFANEIYSDLQQDYESLTSDEQVKEGLIANEAMFKENGEID